MTDLIDWHGNSDDPQPVERDCPECGSDDTWTSAFNAKNPGDPAWFSSWCEDCGYGFGAESLAN